MAITSSAKKAHRASLKKHVSNLRRKKALLIATKALHKAVDAGGPEAEKLLRDAYKAIDKAAKRGVIKWNTAARKKSRLARLVGRKNSPK